MKMTYEEYLKIKKKKLELSHLIDLVIEGTADIPFIGNSVRATSSKISNAISEKNNITNSIKEPENTNYFIALADNFYDEIAIKIFKILELEKVRKKYNYDMSNIEFELFETFDEDTFEVEENYIWINFLDNEYYNPNLEKYEYGSIIITFKEDFKQINFADNKIYSCFEIITMGGNNSFNDNGRDYIEFARLICYLLSAKKID